MVHQSTTGFAVTKPKSVAAVLGPSGNPKLGGPWRVCPVFLLTAHPNNEELTSLWFRLCLEVLPDLMGNEKMEVWVLNNDYWESTILVDSISAWFPL